MGCADSLSAEEDVTEGVVDGVVPREAVLMGLAGGHDRDGCVPDETAHESRAWDRSNGSAGARFVEGRVVMVDDVNCPLT